MNGFEFLSNNPVGFAIFIFGLVVALGLALGSIKVLGVKFGMAGVLFSGILFGHFQITIDHGIMDFVREFGLVLFVYSLGMQVGPGFFDSWKKNGLQLNLMAVSVVSMGILITLFLIYGLHVPIPAALGLLSGATTNTPSLAASQQALKEIPRLAHWAAIPGLGYAVAYPFGIIGVISTMILGRVLFRVNGHAEMASYDREHAHAHPSLQNIDLKIENPNLDGIEIKNIPGLRDSGVVISRVFQDGEMKVALPDTVIQKNDLIRAVGPAEKLKELQLIVGTVAKIDNRSASGKIVLKRIIVTKPEVVGKSLQELDARQRYGVTVTRVERADLEILATPEIEMHVGDTLIVVGTEDSIEKFGKEMGNSAKDLDHPHLIPTFLGMALGALLGLTPIAIPGVPAPVKLGLAGGPLVVALILSRIGRIGKLIWHMPRAANFMIREMGIALFLACVGLKSGDQFFKVLLQGDGFYWMLCAAFITLLPMLVTLFIGRAVLKLNYLTLCGLLAGTMTDPPALAFANQWMPSNAQIVSYATVYPLVMIMRVVSAQLLVIFLC